MTSADAEEHRLAVMTAWAFFGAFGVCLILSGFAEQSPVAGLSGFATIILGFIAHVIVNRIYRAGFSQPQVALGLGGFTVGALCFIASVRPISRKTARRTTSVKDSPPRLACRSFS